MTDACKSISTQELHQLSTQAQGERALVEAQKTGNQPFIRLFTQSISRAAQKLEKTPSYQETFCSTVFRELGSISASIRPEERCIMLDQALKILSIVERYNVVMTIEPHIPGVLDPHHNHYRSMMEIPQCVKKFDCTKKHTIPLSQYIDVRMSKPIQRFVQLGTSIDVFVGPTEDAEKFYYHEFKHRFELKGHLNTRSSINYLLFENKKGEQKVVVIGISNESKLTHTLLQLKAAGVTLDRVSVRGNVDLCTEVLQKKLEGYLRHVVGAKPIALAVIGNRSGLVLETAHRLYPNEMEGPFANNDEQEKNAEELLKDHHNLRTVDIDGIFKFSTVEVDIDGKRQVLLAFRMPNGDLSRIATRIILKHREGVTGLVMVGAGGSLREDSTVGTYQVTTTSRLSTGVQSDEGIKIDHSLVMGLPFQKREACFEDDNTNLTVISPLVETEEWLAMAKSTAQSVDVETFYIMEAYQQAVQGKQIATKIFPGLFISDQVGSHPLIDKIDVNSAWPHLPFLLESALSHLNVDDHRPTEPRVVELKDEPRSAQKKNGWSWNTQTIGGALALTAAIAAGFAFTRK